MKNIYEILKPFDFNYQGLECKLEFNLEKKYKNGKSIIRILKRRNENSAFLFATLSVESPELDLNYNEFVLNNNPLYKELIDFLLNETNYFIDSGKTIYYKNNETSIWRINI